MGNSTVTDVTFRLLNFNLAQTNDEKELSSFSFMNMFLPSDSWDRLKSRDSVR